MGPAVICHHPICSVTSKPLRPVCKLSVPVLDLLASLDFAGSKLAFTGLHPFETSTGVPHGTSTCRLAFRCKSPLTRSSRSRTSRRGWENTQTTLTTPYHTHCQCLPSSRSRVSKGTFSGGVMEKLQEDASLMHGIVYCP